MGNQLTGIAPSQIQPVDQYLTDIPDYQYENRSDEILKMQIMVKNVSGQIDVEHFINILDQVHMNYLILVFHSEKLMLHIKHVYSLIKNMH